MWLAPCCSRGDLRMRQLRQLAERGLVGGAGAIMASQQTRLGRAPTPLAPKVALEIMRHFLVFF